MHLPKRRENSFLLEMNINIYTNLIFIHQNVEIMKMLLGAVTHACNSCTQDTKARENV